MTQGCGNVTMLQWIVYILYSSESWRNISSTASYRLREDVTNLMLWLQCCIDVAIGTSMICCEVNLQSNVEVTLVVQHCEFDVVVLRLWRHFKFDVAISTLQQRCQYNIHSTPGVKLTILCWGNLGAILQFWRCGINATTTLFIGCTTLRPSHNAVTTLRVSWVRSCDATVGHAVNL